MRLSTLPARPSPWPTCSFSGAGNLNLPGNSPSLRKISHTYGFNSQQPRLYHQPDFLLDLQT
jgi:hypothetical protein